MNIFVAISSFILLPILTKSLTISDYGIWVQFNTTVGLISIITTIGLPYTMVRFLSSEREKFQIQDGFYSIIVIVLLLNLICCVLILLFSNSIAKGLFGGNITVVLFLPFTISLASLNIILINFFRATNLIKIYSIFLLLQTYLNVFLVSYSILAGYNLLGALTGFLLTNTIIFLIFFTIIISYIGFKFPEFKKTKKYLSFGIPTIPANLSYWIMDSSDRYIIGLILGTTYVGYYSPGYILGSVILLFLAPFSTILTPTLSKYYDKHQIEEINNVLKYSSKYFLLLTIPSVLGLSLISKSLLTILTNPEIAMESYIITPFIAGSFLFYGLYEIVSQIVILNKKTKIIGIVFFIGAILNVLLNLIFVPKFGIIAAAMMTTTAYIFTFISILIYSQKYLNFHFDFDFKSIIKSVIASLVMSLIIIFLDPSSNLLNIIIVIIISFISYIATLIVLKAINKEEILFIKDMIKN